MKEKERELNERYIESRIKDDPYEVKELIRSLEHNTCTDYYLKMCDEEILRQQGMCIIDSDGLKKVRCRRCKKLLARIKRSAEIKCPKCRTLNWFE